VLFSEPKIPQYRKEWVWLPSSHSFSALQRAENSSIAVGSRHPPPRGDVSVLFSEPKIPQFQRRRRDVADHRVSVLFSEPKIPQLTQPPPASSTVNVFQCSSASRKFLNFSPPPRSAVNARCFSALQRAENSSI